MPDDRDTQVAFSELALLHFRSPRTAGPLSGSILFVADLLHPVDRAAVQRLLNSDMHHRRRARRAVPVLLTGGANHTTSPGRISSMGPPQRCTHPMPNV